MIALYMAGLLTFQSLSMAQTSTLWIFIGLVAVLLSGFYFIFLTDLYLNFREKRLKLPIVSTCLASMLFICYIDLATHILFTPFLFIAIAYAT